MTKERIAKKVRMTMGSFMVFVVKPQLFLQLYARSLILNETKADAMMNEIFNENQGEVVSIRLQEQLMDCAELHLVSVKCMRKCNASHMCVQLRTMTPLANSNSGPHLSIL